MKIYFLDDQRSVVAEFADESAAPEHVAAFPLADGQSTFALRYTLVDGALVDAYPDMTDEEVAAAINAAEIARAAELARLNRPPLSRAELTLRFTRDERIAMKASTDPIVQDFLDLLGAVETFDLNDAELGSTINHLEAAGIIATGRAAEILA